MDNGEVEHAETKHLERVAWFGFSSEGRHYRKAGLNLLATIVIYWNTANPGETVRQRKHADLTVAPELLSHISPLGGFTSCSLDNSGALSTDSGLRNYLKRRMN